MNVSTSSADRNASFSAQPAIPHRSKTEEISDEFF
jgi:hypothetical protein